MKTVIVGSTNPVKIDAARQSFAAMFPDDEFTFQGASAPSNVAEQPLSSDETLLGALNRVEHCRAHAPDADYWIAFEGGLEPKGDHLVSVIWVVVCDRHGKYSQTTCASFTLPEKVTALIRGGMTLGEADDQVFARTNSKQQNGAIGLLTGDVLTRTSVYTQGGILALVPYKNADLY